ncbi:unnamed protein product, partial [Symbiodinium sp. KB8]
VLYPNETRKRAITLLERHLLFSTEIIEAGLAYQRELKSKEILGLEERSRRYQAHNEAAAALSIGTVERYLRAKGVIPPRSRKSKASVSPTSPSTPALVSPVAPSSRQPVKTQRPQARAIPDTAVTRMANKIRATIATINLSEVFRIEPHDEFYKKTLIAHQGAKWRRQAKHAQRTRLRAEFLANLDARHAAAPDERQRLDVMPGHVAAASIRRMGSAPGKWFSLTHKVKPGPRKEAPEPRDCYNRCCDRCTESFQRSFSCWQRCTSALARCFSRCCLRCLRSFDIFSKTELPIEKAMAVENLDLPDAGSTPGSSMAVPLSSSFAPQQEANSGPSQSAEVRVADQQVVIQPAEGWERDSEDEKDSGSESEDEDEAFAEEAVRFEPDDREGASIEEVSGEDDAERQESKEEERGKEATQGLFGSLFQAAANIPHMLYTGKRKRKARDWLQLEWADIGLFVHKNLHRWVSSAASTPHSQVMRCIAQMD